jgi:hypothetical protein
LDVRLCAVAHCNPHLSISYGGMEPAGKCRHSIGSSHAVQQWRLHFPVLVVLNT